eukprot:TRINITY_DN3379_c0_g2_i1.p1 TRINITY_DN3379_c0_g2~~TRINITY_DN3379_c0_g2_i1.p1  ORF type:complete len:220 (+),score=49.16 TRINITY_DN3379_c0_g2_i1:98-757(+)
MMCTSTAGIMAGSAETDSVQQIVMAAVAASAQAGPKAAKRRVRQRLHKKLGSMLPADEYEKRVKDFEVVTKSMRSTWGHQLPLPVLLQSTSSHNQVGLSGQMPAARTAAMAMPHVAATETLALAARVVPIFNQTVCEVQGTKNQQPSPHEQDRALSCASTAGGSTTQDFLEEDLDGIIAESSAEWKRAISNPEHRLPIKRTFIQFDTREHLPRRRSLSV